LTNKGGNSILLRRETLILCQEDFLFLENEVSPDQRASAKERALREIQILQDRLSYTRTKNWINPENAVNNIRGDKKVPMPKARLHNKLFNQLFEANPT